MIGAARKLDTSGIRPLKGRRAVSAYVVDGFGQALRLLRNMDRDNRSASHSGRFMNSEERHHPSMFLAVVLSLAVPAHADSNVAVIVVNPITGSVDAGTDATYEASRRYGMSQCKFWPSKQVEKGACRILAECHASGYAAVARGGTT